jgi:hypothetical protein
MKKTKRKRSAPRPDQLPGEIKYRPPTGKASDRPLARIKQGQPQKAKP